MIHDIRYKTRNIKGAYLYVPDSYDKPLPLVIWLTGGNDGAQLPLRFSLGKLLHRGTLAPECAVLMPAAAYGHNYTTMTDKELLDIIMMAADMADINMDSVAICGWSLGADAAAIMSERSSLLFDKVCLMSNYPDEWHGTIPVPDYRILVGAREKSAKRDWGLYDVERVDGYGHELGEKIWLDKSVDLLGWLIKED